MSHSNVSMSTWLTWPCYLSSLVWACPLISIESFLPLILCSTHVCSLSLGSLFFPVGPLWSDSMLSLDSSVALFNFSPQLPKYFPKTNLQPCHFFAKTSSVVSHCSPNESLAPWHERKGFKTLGPTLAFWLDFQFLLHPPCPAPPCSSYFLSSESSSLHFYLTNRYLSFNSLLNYPPFPLSQGLWLNHCMFHAS